MNAPCRDRHWPLLAAYPALAESLQPIKLASLPTPIQHLPALGVRAWIKRDDLTHPLYAGNKLRKLEFVLPDIQRQGARQVITFGATGTNAGIAAGMICQQAGLSCTVLTFPQMHSATVQENQRWLRHFGVHQQACSSLWQAALRFYLHPGRLRRDNYFLFAGCSNPVSTFGYLNAAFELREQIKNGLCPEPGEIIVPVSSGSTLAGLNLGVTLAGLKCRVTGIRVAPEKLGPFAACTPGEVMKFQQYALKKMHTLDSATALQRAPAVHLDSRYYGTGYGHASAKAETAMLIMKEASGLFLESTYSGKAAAAFLDALEASRKPVLFWNTFNSRPLPSGRAGRATPEIRD